MVVYFDGRPYYKEIQYDFGSAELTSTTLTDLDACMTGMF